MMNIEPDVFAKLVNLLASKSYNAEAMVLQLAKVEPAMFVLLAEYKSPDTNTPQWHRDAVAFILKGETVNAIKTVRTGTGMGLKEAKDVIDAVRYHAFDTKHAVNAPISDYPYLEAAQSRLVANLNQIVDQRS